MILSNEQFTGRRILVTGGAGFVGSAVVARLAEAGAEVVVLDDLFTGEETSLPAGVEFVRGSVTNPDIVRDAVRRASLVFHLAARSIIASTKNPRDDYETNIGGTLNVLLAARELGVDRVVYSSSASIYGNPRSIPINEEDHLEPLSPYAVSKLAGENYCLAFYESYAVPVSVVRYSNVYGPGQRPENPYSGVVSKFLDHARAAEPLPIHGDGEQTRDFTYIDDTVEATLLAAVHPRAEGEVFNVGTGIETSVTVLAGTVAAAVGVPLETIMINRRDVDNIRRRVLNIEKVRRMLQWTPTVTVRAGVERTAEWFDRHEAGRAAATGIKDREGTRHARPGAAKVHGHQEPESASPSPSPSPSGITASSR